MCVLGRWGMWRSGRWRKEEGHVASRAWGGKLGGVSSEEPWGLAHGRHGHADREGSAIASLGHLTAGFFSRL